MTYFRTNRIQCTVCKDIIEYTHESKDSNLGFLIHCKCGKTAIDPAAFASCYRVIFPVGSNPPEDLSDIWED